MTETFFEISEQSKSHNPRKDVFNAGNSDTGGVSTTSSLHNRPRQQWPKRTQNDKYLIDYFEGRSVKCIEDYFHEYGFCMQQNFFEIKEEEFFNNQSSF